MHSNTKDNDPLSRIEQLEIQEKRIPIKIENITFPRETKKKRITYENYETEDTEDVNKLKWANLIVKKPNLHPKNIALANKEQLRSSLKLMDSGCFSKQLEKLNETLPEEKKFEITKVELTPSQWMAVNMLVVTNILPLKDTTNPVSLTQEHFPTCSTGFSSYPGSGTYQSQAETLLLNSGFVNNFRAKGEKEGAMSLVLGETNSQLNESSLKYIKRAHFFLQKAHQLNIKLNYNQVDNISKTLDQMSRLIVETKLIIEKSKSEYQITYGNKKEI